MWFSDTARQWALGLSIEKHGRNRICTTKMDMVDVGLTPTSNKIYAKA